VAAILFSHKGFVLVIWQPPNRDIKTNQEKDLTTTKLSFQKKFEKMTWQHPAHFFKNSWRK
jgi:hypothetical protein